MKTILLTVLTLFCLSLCSSTLAAVDMFIKIKGIEGESIDNDHGGEIDVLAWSWGAAHATRVDGTSNKGQQTKKVEVNEFTFTKKTDTATPRLALACANGTHFDEAVLIVRKAGGTREDEYIMVKMTRVIISRIDIGQMDKEQDVPTENVTLNFAKVEFLYIRKNPDGSEDIIPAGYDLSKGKKV